MLFTSDNFSKKAGKKISKALNRATEMKNARTCFSVLIALSLVFLFASSVIADDVVVLTEDNFDKEVGQDRDALVEFYAPWYQKLSLSQFSVWLHRKFIFLENQIENSISVSCIVFDELFIVLLKFFFFLNDRFSNMCF